MKVLIFSENDHSIPRKYWEHSIPLLRQKGIDAQFATITEKEKLHHVFEKDGVPAYAFNGKKATDYFRISRQLAQFAHKEKFDIIHASESIAATIAGLACLFLPNTKCIFHYHHTVLHGKPRIFSAVGSRLADLVMAVSKSSQRATIEFDKTQPSKTKVAYNGTQPLRAVSKKELGELRQHLKIPENARIISIIARLRAEKGHRTLFEAADVAAKSGRLPIHVVVAGDGCEEMSLREAASGYRDIIVHFTGNQEDIAPWFAIGDIVTVPSYIESFGLAAIEAMSCGKPLIASGVQGLLEIVEDGVNGVLVPPREPMPLAKAIIKVLSSPEFAQKLGENGPKRVHEKFTMETMVNGWIECYRMALDDRDHF